MKRILALLAGSVIIGSAWADTHYVDINNATPVPPYTNGWASAANTLTAAVAHAETTDGDVVLVNTGAYVLAATITIDKGITVRANSTNRSDVVVDGANAVRCVYVNHADARMEGFTVTGGRSDYGAGVRVGSGTVADCLITANTNNSAANINTTKAGGGGVYVGGDSLLSNCVIRANASLSHYGSGLACARGAVIQECLFEANAGGSYAVHFYAAGTGDSALMLDSVVSNNAVRGVYVDGGAVVRNSLIATNVGGVALINGLVEDCEIVENYNNSGVSINGLPETAVLRGCLIARNNNPTSNRGGGIYFYPGGGLVENCVIRDNSGIAYSASAGGGGITTYIARDYVIRNCLIAGNYSAGYGGGIYFGSSGGDDYAGKVYNCTIVANRSALGGGGVYSASASNLFVNTIILGNTGGNVNNSTANYFYHCCTAPTNGLQGAANREADPLFVNPDAGNYRLTRGSLCINAGTNLAVLEETLDLDGQLRMHEAIVDIGAYEAAPVPYLVNGGASAIGSDNATLNGELIFTGTTAAVVWAYWGTTDGGTNKTAWATNGCLNERELGFLAYSVTSLNPDTLYYFTFYASTEFGGFWPYAGAVKFSTAGAPAVTNTGAVTARNTYMDLSGEVLVGYPAPTVWIYWGESDAEEDPALWEHSAFVGVVTNWTFTATIDVRPDRTYFYRCLVSNEHGVGWSPTATPFTLDGVHYVNKNNPTPASPFLSWTDAATNIQDAIDAAGVGEVVLVTNEVYDTGGKLNGSTYPTNRVLLSKSVTVIAVSTNPADTVIVGAPHMSGGTPANGNGAVRCAYVGSGCSLIGFTLTNGWTASGTQGTDNRRGGGVLCPDSTAVIKNCVITDGHADLEGGGVYRGTLYRCLIAGSYAKSHGGGTHSAYLYDGCVVSNNVAQSMGGGLYSSHAYDSTIVTNRAVTSTGGGANGGSVTRCQILLNTGAELGGGIAGASGQACTIAFNTVTGGGSNGGAGGGGVGGGSVNECLIAFNTSTYRGGGLGGTVTAENCQIVSNTVTSGYGGGAGNQWANITARNCLFEGNTASSTAGGVQGAGLLEGCVIRDNHSGSGETALKTCNTIRNCLIVGNKRPGATLSVPAAAYVNCTIVDNDGAVTGGSTLKNCIVYSNSVNVTANQSYSMSYSCVETAGVSGVTINGGFNTTNNPQFLNAAAGDYRISAESPCVDKGGNEIWMVASKDVGGTNCRIVNATVDMGAYEYSDGSLNASFGADPRNSLVPTLNTFTALASETNMAALHYQWDFDNDGNVDWAGWGQDVVTHSYTEPGYYSSSLTVSNMAGERCSFTNLLYVKAGPITYYVAMDGPEIHPYTNWTVAASHLPPVFALLSDGDTVAVGPGVYEQSAQLTLSVGAAVTSVNGAAATTLARPPSAGSFRVFQLNHASAELSGFTIANGSLTAANNDGGGVYVSLGLLNRCVVSNCYTSRDGAGVYLNNSATAWVRNCVMVGNTAARYGGGAAVNKLGTLESCTIAGNTASNSGGGVAAVALSGMQVLNSVVHGNTSPVSNNWTVVGSGTYGFTACLTTPTSGLSGTGNLNANPLFKDPVGGNYRLGAGSPGFDAGVYQDWMATAADLDGRPRVLFGAPDIGAYEYPSRHTGAVIVVK